MLPTWGRFSFLGVWPITCSSKTRRGLSHQRQDSRTKTCLHVYLPLPQFMRDSWHVLLVEPSHWVLHGPAASPSADTHPSESGYKCFGTASALQPKGPTLPLHLQLPQQGVTWVGTRSKFFPSILLMCFLAWDVIWCLSRKENWQPSRMQWKWLFTWLYLQPADTKPTLTLHIKVLRRSRTRGKMIGQNVISGHGLFRNSLEWKKPKLTIYCLLSNCNCKCTEIYDLSLVPSLVPVS